MNRAVRIVTAAWSTPLPPDVVRIGISRGWPRRESGYRRLPLLAPGPWFHSIDEREFMTRYQEQLSDLRPEYVYNRLLELASGAPCVALLCFEKPCTSDGWCHRSLTASWLSKGLGIAVPEFGFELLDQDQHPMLPCGGGR